MAGQDRDRRFYHYPLPVQGPDVPYTNEIASNPALRGRLLEIGASLVQSSTFIQGILWRNAGFKAIHIQGLDGYEPRYNPAVIPIVNYAPPTATAAEANGAIKAHGYYSSADYRSRYLSGELTPLIVVETLLPLIRRDISPPGEHSIAFLDSKVEKIREAAEASTARYKNGTSLGPMDGIPVAVKDEVDVSGYKTNLGTKMDFTVPSGGTSWCVRKWEKAGAIIIGKTTMHELGLDTSNNNPNFGTPRNPHNPNFYTGGSSGGSGYAVSAGLVPIALGADGGGSIRIPASFCGVYGLKPSHGRISGAPTVGIASTTGVFGPLASNLNDLQLSFQIMAKPDPDNITSSCFPDSSVQTVRARPKVIGVYQEWVKQSDPSVLALFNQTMKYYRSQKGYEIIDITIPYIPEGQKAHALTILSEIGSGISKDRIPHLTAANKVLVASAHSQISALDFFAAQKLRGVLMSHLAYLFNEYPGMIIATPTLPIAGWKINGEADLTNGISDTNMSLRTMIYVYLANFAGCPAISRPMGYAEDTRMPIGLMGMGEWGSEWELIEWCRDGEGLLSSDEGAAKTADEADDYAAAGVAEGLKRPSAESGGKWVDVIDLAKSDNPTI